jgi:carbonic anhydrase
MKITTLAIGLGAVLASSSPSLDAAEIHWGYEHGTEGWGELDPSFEQCSSGLQQSPIDVVPGTAVRADLPALTFRYGTQVDFTMSHNGHTVVATPTTTTNTLTIGTKLYTLKQFHMHTPSENFLNGESYPLEYHFVHQAGDGALAVVGVFFDDADSSNSQIGQLISAMPTETTTHTLQEFNLRRFVPTGRSYRFPGSLTTPPCGEGVAWHVMATVKTASASQIAAFMNEFSGTHFPGGNRRPVQSRNARRLQTED